jgi:hypothetical protein
MRFTGTFFWVLVLLVTPLKIATGNGWGPGWAAPVALAGMAAALMMALLWTLIVVFGGGPRRFYAENLAWKQQAQRPLPPLVAPVAVDTATVLESHGSSWHSYVPWLRGQAAYAVPAGLPVVLYAVVMIVLGRTAGPVVWSLALCIGPLILFGAIHTFLVYTRTALLIHPNGVTVQGAWRKVVLDDTSNCVLVTGEALTGLYDMGTIYVNRATRQRAAVWELALSVPVEHIVRTRLPRTVTANQPSRDLAPYVSITQRAPQVLTCGIVLALIVIVTAVLVSAGVDGS